MATGAPVPYYVANPDDEDAQQYSPAVRALAGTGRAPIANMPTIAARQPMPDAPTAPTIDMGQYQKLQQAAAPQTVDRAAYKPKWYERLAGGLAAAGIGYRDPAEGVKVGSAITGRRYNQAVEDEGAREAGAEKNLKNFEGGVDMQAKNYGLASQAYGNQVRGRELGDEEGNQDWLHQYDTANAQREQGNSDREFQRGTANDSWSHNMQTQQFGETQKQHGIENKNKQTELGYEGQRVKIDQDRETRDRTQAKGDVLKRGVDANKLDATRQTQLKALDQDNPKTGDPGYLSQRNSLWLSKKNPDTGKAWQPGEREKAIGSLDSQHAEAKNEVEQAYAQSMNNLGYSVAPVTYGPDGKTVVNESNGAPPQAAPPQNAPTRAAAAPAGKQPQRSTPAGMVLVQKPDGSTVYIPKANIAGAQKLGGKVLDQGQ